jgi:hypothetical protein
VKTLFMLADVEIGNWIKGKTALLDVRITNPTCQYVAKKSATTP